MPAIAKWKKKWQTPNQSAKRAYFFPRCSSSKRYLNIPATIENTATILYSSVFSNVWRYCSSRRSALWFWLVLSRCNKGSRRVFLTLTHKRMLRVNLYLFLSARLDCLWVCTVHCPLRQRSRARNQCSFIVARLFPKSDALRNGALCRWIIFIHFCFPSRGGRYTSVYASRRQKKS